MKKINFKLPGTLILINGVTSKPLHKQICNGWWVLSGVTPLYKIHTCRSWFSKEERNISRSSLLGITVLTSEERLLWIVEEAMGTNDWMANSGPPDKLCPGILSASVKPSKSSEWEEKDRQSSICSSPVETHPLLLRLGL